VLAFVLVLPGWTVQADHKAWCRPAM
jgi:hypothetical protein